MTHLGRVWLPLLLVAALGAAAFAPTPVGAGQMADDYSDSEYRDHDVDNYTRARARMYQEALDPEYGASFASACVDTQGRAALKQANEAKDGRVYGGVGQATCWWSVGHAPDYHEVTPHRIHFFARTGAKLQGHIWGLENAGRRPGIVITTGSIQASDQMYWWAARALAAAGYVVMTYDVQGQGQSETFSHEPGSPVPGLTNVPSQQDPNFYDGTIDALNFFLSTPDDPYVPVGWSEGDVEAANNASNDEPVDWINPAGGVLDRGNLGIIGHSLGARAVSNVQQCSDEGRLWRDLELCAGRSYPIRAVIGWDSLSSGVTPVVPGMSQDSDGYFLTPTLEPQMDWDPKEALDAHQTWSTAGLDTFSYVVRAGTHIEWSQVPYTPATTYGVHMNTYYTLAWMHRYLWPDRDVQRHGYQMLVDGPKLDPEHPSRASATYMSVRRYSGFRLSPPVGHGKGRVIQTDDIRHQYAGRSAISDWAGANEDTAGEFDPTAPGG